mgnify:CR=1 FL=1
MPLHLYVLVQVGLSGMQVKSLGQGAIFKPHGRPTALDCASARLFIPMSVNARTFLINIVAEIS